MATAATSASHLPAEASGSATASSSSSSVAALISKRAKAVHKKLQRINAYSEGTLNADQQRAIATKPTLQAIEAELSTLLSQATAHEASQKSEAQAEIDRLTDLVNSNAQRADQLQSQLHFLLQFLHLYALVQSPASDSQQSAQLPPGLAATISPTDIQALTSIFYAFANAPLVQPPAFSGEGALEIIDRIRSADPSEIVISDSTAPDHPARVTHSRIAELVQALTAAPPIPTRFDAADELPTSSEDSLQAPTQPKQISFGASATVPDDEQDSSAAPIPMPVPHLANTDSSVPELVSSSIVASTIPFDTTAQQQSQSSSYPVFDANDADLGFSVGTGPVPPPASGRILFMQASEVEGEVEPEPSVFGIQPSLSGQMQHQQPPLRFDAGAEEDEVEAEAQAAPPAEPAHTIEPEGGAVDGAPEAEPVPAAQPDALTTEPAPPVLRDLVTPAPAAADSNPAGPTQDPSAPLEAPPLVVDVSASAAPAPARKIDWASLDEDDDVDEISEEVMRSVVLSGTPAATSTTTSAPKATAQQQSSVPPAAEAEATRLAKQIEPTNQPRANGSGNANGTNARSGRSGTGGGKQQSSAPAPAPVLRKAEPIVDEDGFVMQVTKKTLRQQQLAAQQQQQQQQQNRGAGGGRSGGRGNSGGGGARSGRPQGQGQRRERREGNVSSSSDAATAAAAGTPSNGSAGGQQKERTSSSGQQQPNSGWRTNSGSGAGRGSGAGSGGAAPNTSGGRGRGNRNRAPNASGSGPRPSNAQAEGPAPSA
ncbi:hypothetical protein OC845_004442 [Tilletia horrida]|nr:hypothetical protein OC845_004442 [Tilletia horrida]